MKAMILSAGIILAFLSTLILGAMGMLLVLDSEIWESMHQHLFSDHALYIALVLSAWVGLSFMLQKMMEGSPEE